MLLLCAEVYEDYKSCNIASSYKKKISTTSKLYFTNTSHFLRCGLERIQLYAKPVLQKCPTEMDPDSIRSALQK